MVALNSVSDADGQSIKQAYFRGIMLPAVVLLVSMSSSSYAASASTFVALTAQNVITLVPEKLGFKTGLAGEIISVKYNNYIDSHSSGVYVVQGNFAPGCRSVRAHFGGGIVTSNPPGQNANWFKLSDTLEYALISTYYGTSYASSTLSSTMNLTTDYTLCSDGTPAPSSALYAPFATGTEVRFRLTKNIIDTPTYVPARELGGFHLGYYGPDESSLIPAFLSFIGAIRPQIVFRINAGYLSMPNPRCEVSPANINVDFGIQTPSSINGVQKTKQVSVNCSTGTRFSMTINSSQVQAVPNGLLINTSNPTVFAKITTDRQPESTGVGVFKGYDAHANTPLSIPLNIEMVSDKPTPGDTEGVAWATFTYE